MPNQRIDLLLQQIAACHPNDVVQTVSSSERESSMILVEHVPPFIQRYKISIQPAYQDKFNAMGGVDAVLQQLVTVIQNKINSETIAQNRETYQVALRALQDPNTMEWPSVLHAGATQTAHEILLRELLAYYWLAASDEQMTFSDNFANDVALDPSLRESLIQASIVNFICLVAECRTAHNNKHAVPAQTLDAPSCIPGTFGRIVLRSSVYNKLTEVNGAIFAMIIPEIRNFIAAEMSRFPDETKTQIFRAISDKLITGQGDSMMQYILESKLNDLRSELHIQNLFSLLTTSVPGLLMHSPIVQTALREIYNIELNILNLDNDMPDQNFIDQLRKITYTPLATAYYKELTSNDAAIIKTRLDIFALAQRLDAVDLLLDDEIMKSLLLPGHLTNTNAKTRFDRFAHLVFHQYAVDLENAESTLNKLLEERARTFEKNNLEQEAIRVQAPITVEQSIRKRAARANNQLTQITKKVDALTDAFKNTVMTLGSEDDDDAGFSMVVLPLWNNYHKFDMNRTSAKKWAWNFMRVICSVYPKYPIEYVVPQLYKWIDLMIATIDPATVTECLIAVNQHIESLKLPSQSLSDIIQTLSRLFKSRNLTLNNIYEFMTYADFIPEFNQQFANLGDLPTWYQRANESLIHVKIIEGSSSQITIIPCDVQSSSRIWAAAVEEIAANDTQRPYSSRTLDRIHHFTVLTLFRNLQLTEMRISDAQTLKWICSHYLYPDTPSEIQNCQFTRNIDGLCAHISALVTTLNTVPDLFNSGYIRLMSAKETRTHLGDTHSIARTSSNRNSYIGISPQIPTIFRVSNSLPNLLALSTPTYHRRLASDISYTTGRRDVATMVERQLQNQTLQFVIFSPTAFNLYLLENNLTPTLALIPFNEATSLTYHVNRIVEYFGTDPQTETDYTRGARQLSANGANVIHEVQQELNGQNAAHQTGSVSASTQGFFSSENAGNSDAHVSDVVGPRTH